MNYFFDTEFIEDGKTIELISLGIVAEDGREFYAESYDFDPEKALPWVRENVFPHLEVNPDARWDPALGLPSGFCPDHGHRHYFGYRVDIRHELLRWIGNDKPVFWGYFPSYDWVVLCQLFGRMIDLPEGWPMRPNDIAQWGVRFPEQTSTKHNALNDARWVRDCFALHRGSDISLREAT